MTKAKSWKCPIDCLCFDCLAKMADPKCQGCGGDGYIVLSPGFLDSEAPCKCTDEKRVKREERAERRRRTQERSPK